MHNSLEGLPKRVVIDANVLLDAAFVTNGGAQRSLTLLSQLGYSPVIDKMIETEAIRILRKYIRSFNLAKLGLEQVLSTHISGVGILRLPPAEPISKTSVNRSDRHVASAAKHYGAWVLTGDAELIFQLSTDNMQARLPFDVIIEAATRDGADPRLEDMFPAVSPTRHSGMIFGRVLAGGWAGSKSDTIHTVLEMENIGRIYYDNRSKEWVFEMPIGASARVKCPLQNGEQWAVCGSYKFSGAGRPGRLFIRAGLYPSTIFQNSEKARKNIVSSLPGKICVGYSVGNQDHWNGDLQSGAIGPQGMSGDTWKHIIAIPKGRPNPYDSNALTKVLESYGQKLCMG